MADDLRKQLEILINCNSMENGSDTPDFILAEYLGECLATFDKTIRAREQWYGRHCGAGVAITGGNEIVAEHQG